MPCYTPYRQTFELLQVVTIIALPTSCLCITSYNYSRCDKRYTFWTRILARILNAFTVVERLLDAEYIARCRTNDFSPICMAFNRMKKKELLLLLTVLLGICGVILWGCDVPIELMNQSRGGELRLNNGLNFNLRTRSRVCRISLINTVDAVMNI